MFQDKKEAEEYDKMLELAENISALIERQLPEVAAEHSEAIGLMLAKHRDLLARACKGKPELLEQAVAADEQEDVQDTKASDKVTSLKAKS